MTIWTRPYSSLAFPVHPSMPERADFYVGTDADSGQAFYLSRFTTRGAYGGQWVLSDSPFPGLSVDGEVLSAVYASGGTDGGLVWFRGPRHNCYPVRGDYIITSADAGYWPSATFDDYGTSAEGDGWYSLTALPATQNDETWGEAEGVLKFDPDAPKNLPVKVYWPRLYWSQLYGTNTNPCREYTQGADGMTGTKTVGLQEWRHGVKAYTQSMTEDETGRYRYGAAKWDTKRQEYIVGTYGHEWFSAPSPSIGSRWDFTAWASGAGGASAVPSADFSATWNGYQWGENTMPAYAGQIAYWREG